jgi:hypothetical protein
VTRTPLPRRSTSKLHTRRVDRKYLYELHLLDGVTLVPEMRKPFDLPVEGLSVSSSRGDKTPIELFVRGVTELTPEVQTLLMRVAAPEAE